MPTGTGLTEQEVQNIATDVLSFRLKPHGFDHVEVRADLDHDGDESLFVTAVVGPDVGALPGDFLAKAHEALNEGLRAHGERRFPYFKLRRMGDTPVDDAASATL